MISWLREGATENTVVVQALIDNLLARGLDPTLPRLFIVDGAKAPSKAIRNTFGVAAAIQRCQVHKGRNIIERLPQHLHASVKKALRQAWDQDDANKAERLLRNLARRLEHEEPGVSGSILEGLEEILTVIRLGLPHELRRSLACTNIVENALGTVRQVTRNVKRWRHAEMALRWTAAGRLEAQKTFREAGAFLLDCEAARLMDLGQRLGAYRLRADIELLDATEDWRVVAVLGDGAEARLGLTLAEPGAVAALEGGGLIYRDPRPQMPGLRAFVPRDAGFAQLETAGISAGTLTDYERVRIAAGVPDGSRDMTVNKSTLLEFGFEALRGVDFEKGCYVGQELTARTKYRGLVRRRLQRVFVDGALPAPGTPIMANDKEAGEICSGADDQALALLRLDRSAEAEAAGISLTAGKVTLRLPKNDTA